ncbi:hypothetical protein [Caballeronia ptereochthonis]|uniref:Restriction endonuclease type IV Mrr domain-containing protein n=1 Tax=Caballeronia ptereochthonis TaxID=1777144 RepID=A0A157Z3J0_9BURK|nr:hypothetical protein [Caballeronia ptereochthonis]SAK40125.1 hypothetical protein AWB83_00149 [Caballeronia ptereochthonis]
MDFIEKQIPPPKSWEKFEDLTRALFAAVWKAPLAQKNGRSGQQQHGVDIYGTPEVAPGKNFGVQCKGKNKGYRAKATIAEFDAELAKAEKFKPALGHWTFATTAPNDATLQEHARLVSERREKEGKFPVVAIGWDTIQALLSSHQTVVEEFYPEHAGDLPKIMAALRALPRADELDQMRRSLIAFVPRSAVVETEVSEWSEVQFEVARDLGPALMGRSLGPADVAACPTLPEVALLTADLERAGSARLAGVPGAGKSISILQVARQMHDRGWRVLRLADPMGRVPPFDESSNRTLYIVDDAHLTRPALLRELEERATASCWVLSAYTISDDKGGFPGAIQLDAKRAVRVIADGLRSSPEATLAAVRRADDRIGDRPGDERFDLRLEHAAEQALYPWQFCFILGGGWRRASALASTARAAGADLLLAAVAIRQLAARDAHCSRDALLRLVGDALPIAESNAAINWLVAQRFLLSFDDLRCPHQRLASVLLARILDGQSAEERQMVACVLKTVLADGGMPLGGLAVLLGELSMADGYGQWRWLVQQEWLPPVLARCWAATDPLDIRHACWVLSNLHGYMSDEMSQIASHKETLAEWIEAAPEGACYAIARVVNHVLNTDKTLGESIVALVDPCVMARAISTASPLHAGEIADLLSTIGAGRDDEWKACYLEHIDRDACRRLTSTWPQDAYLSVVADFCKHFCYFEQEFGFTLIEVLIPAIADRLRANPQDAFDELRDIVWNALRLYDPLHIYVGKLAPSRRMRQVGRKICACWSPKNLATELSRSTHRNFQAAAGLLSFMHKASPKQFEATILALDWNKIDQTIGADWAEGIGNAKMLLGVAYTVPAARFEIQAMVERNESRIVTMSAHLAALAPASALRHVAAGRRIALCQGGHVDWQLGALVLIRVVQSELTLVPVLLEPHYCGLAEALSQPSPTFYNDGLFFLRLLVQVEPVGSTRVLDHIDVKKAQIGWRNAIRGLENNREPGAKAQARQVVSLLIQHALDRNDAVGELARQLRRDFPSKSVPSAKTVEPIDLTEPIK